MDAGGAFPPLLAAMLVGAAIGAVVAAGEFWFAAGVGAVLGAAEGALFFGLGKVFTAARLGSRVTAALRQAFGRGGCYVDIVIEP